MPLQMAYANAANGIKAAATVWEVTIVSYLARSGTGTVTTVGYFDDAACKKGTGFVFPDAYSVSADDWTKYFAGQTDLVAAAQTWLKETVKFHKDATVVK